MTENIDYTQPTFAPPYLVLDRIGTEIKRGDVAIVAFMGGLAIAYIKRVSRREDKKSGTSYAINFWVKNNAKLLSEFTINKPELFLVLQDSQLNSEKVLELLGLVQSTMEAAIQFSRAVATKE